MAPQFVKPYVKTNKNDAADAGPVPDRAQQHGRVVGQGVAFDVQTRMAMRVIKASTNAQMPNPA